MFLQIGTASTTFYFELDRPSVISKWDNYFKLGHKNFKMLIFTRLMNFCQYNQNVK